MRWNSKYDQDICLKSARHYLKSLRKYGKMPGTETDNTPASIAAVAESLAREVYSGQRPESWLDQWSDEHAS